MKTQYSETHHVGLNVSGTSQVLSTVAVRPQRICEKAQLFRALQYI